jgi:hypothetical protein
VLVTVYTPSPSGQGPRLANLSALNVIAPGAGALIAGFSSSGSGENQMVIRGIGPTLSSFGVSRPISEPTLQLYEGDRLLDRASSGWSVTDGRELGGFPLPSGSGDAVLPHAATAGGRTVVLGDNRGQSGEGLLEIYLREPAGALRLVNLSTRAQLKENGTLTVGFVLVGPGTSRVLVRAVGPGLAPFAVEGRAEDPQLTLYRIDPDNTRPVERNEDWSSALESTFDAVGAFGLSRGSKDSAIVSTLAAGSYTAVAANREGSEAVMLVELYLLPQ